MLAIYLWKEWCVYRSTLIALTVIALAVCPLMLLLPGSWTPGDYVGKVTACAMLVISITIGAELLPYEQTGQRMQFLGRLPGGEQMAFVAKIVFLLASLSAFTGFTYLVAQGSALFIRPGFTSPLERSHILFVVAGITVCLWAFAISSWISRATLVLPILALLLVFGLRPILDSPLLRTWEDIGVWHLGVYVALMTCGALSFAWTSYVHRLGKSQSNRLRSGSIAGLCLVAPLGLGTWQTQQWFTPDPYAERFKIWSGLIGMEQRYAFLSTLMGRASYHGIIVDLDSGEWRVEGSFESSFESPGGLDDHVFISGLVGEHDFFRLYKQGEDTICYDGMTAKPFDIGTREALRARLEARIRKSTRQTTPIRLPDGRPAWIMNRVLETHDADGNPALLEWSYFPTGRAGMLRGMGIRIFDDKKSAIIDLVRERVYAVNEGRQVPNLVLKKGWLVTKDKQPFLYDPELETLSEAIPLDANDHVVERIGENQVLTYGRNKIYAVDLDSGEREEIPIPAAPKNTQFQMISSDFLGRVPTRPSEGTLLIKLFYRNESHHSIRGVSKFDLKTRRFGPFIEGTYLPMCFPSDDTMLTIVDEQRIERVNLVTGEREILFPREAR